MSNILVNATAARSSGALSILNQFIENIPLESSDRYFIFVDPGFRKINRPNVEYVPINTQSWFARILWDESGLKKWVKDHGLECHLFISLQNTGANTGKQIPQLIYYHQSLPLCDIGWNPIKKEERSFFFYKWFYPFFVKRYSDSKTQFVVQIPSIKNALVKKFKVAPECVHVMKPNIVKIDYSTIKSHDFNDNCIHCIYPATPFVYKNHDDIIEALFRLKQRDILCAERIRVHFTFKSSDFESLYKKVLAYGLEDNVLFEGTLPFGILQSYYKSSDVLLFPSYIETLGLPLLEAAGAGIPIIVSDMPYARDAVGTYEGATFVRLHDIDGWCNAITEICHSGRHYKSYTQQGENDWKCFFELVDQIKIK